MPRTVLLLAVLSASFAGWISVPAFGQISGESAAQGRIVNAPASVPLRDIVMSVTGAPVLGSGRKTTHLGDTRNETAGVFGPVIQAIFNKETR